MKTIATILKFIAASALALVVFAGCESTDSGGYVGGSMYYGVGRYDPWYYGPGYYPPDVIVPPPNRPDVPPRPVHPIIPPPATAPRPTPMPSIPSTPRPASRR